jgi:hypothetical protein
MTLAEARKAGFGGEEGWWSDEGEAPKAHFQSTEKDEGSESDGQVEFGTVEHRCNLTLLGVRQAWAPS